MEGKPRVTRDATIADGLAHPGVHPEAQMNSMETLRRRFDVAEVPEQASCVTLYPPHGFLRCAWRQPYARFEPWATVGWSATIAFGVEQRAQHQETNSLHSQQRC